MNNSDKPPKMEQAMEQFLTVDWTLPPFTSTTVIETIAEALEICGPPRHEEILKKVMPWLYDLEHLSAMYIGRYKSTIHIRDFAPQIAESIEAAAGRLFHAAICSLMPVIEGVLQKMAVERVGQPKRRNWMLPEIDTLIEREEQSPGRFEERIVMLQSLRAIFETRLFVDTALDQSTSRLNRNGILHGLFHDYANQLNFYRLISILDSLCFAIGLKHGGSGFASSETDESKEYLNYLMSVSMASQKRPSSIPSEPILKGSSPLELRFMILQAKRSNG
ncbi:hypothetical protein Hrubri_2867 [Herbaspirillum rubrisubalbicans M1]|uniref:hypothetical protein n=1 Tax=Herbaspirillum rubrisubalbicans TaxID=80842 RepID=UPI00073ACA3D|nr:hypothetical protein [Herbaspirillum rubrisubalbicans]ALU90041.1 hypothetical protein Hrubri_2867 [Herbaspirillum rubrisubalbicans M1]